MGSTHPKLSSKYSWNRLELVKNKQDKIPHPMSRICVSCKTGTMLFYVRALLYYVLELVVIIYSSKWLWNLSPINQPNDKWTNEGTQQHCMKRVHSTISPMKVVDSTLGGRKIGCIWGGRVRKCTRLVPRALSWHGGYVCLMIWPTAVCTSARRPPQHTWPL